MIYKLKDNKRFCTTLIEYYFGFKNSDGDVELDDYRDMMRPFLQKEIKNSKYFKLCLLAEMGTRSLLEISNAIGVSIHKVNGGAEREAKQIFARLMEHETQVEQMLRRKYKAHLYAQPRV